jgi:hypothetical protein
VPNAVRLSNQSHERGAPGVSLYRYKLAVSLELVSPDGEVVTRSRRNVCKWPISTDIALQSNVRSLGYSVSACSHLAANFCHDRDEIFFAEFIFGIFDFGRRNLGGKEKSCRSPIVIGDAAGRVRGSVPENWGRPFRRCARSRLAAVAGESDDDAFTEKTA